MPVHLKGKGCPRGTALESTARCRRATTRMLRPLVCPCRRRNPRTHSLSGIDAIRIGSLVFHLNLMNCKRLRMSVSPPIYGKAFLHQCGNRLTTGTRQGSAVGERRSMTLRGQSKGEVNVSPGFRQNARVGITLGDRHAAATCRASRLPDRQPVGHSRPLAPLAGHHAPATPNSIILTGLDHPADTFGPVHGPSERLRAPTVTAPPSAGGNLGHRRRSRGCWRRGPTTGS